MVPYKAALVVLILAIATGNGVHAGWFAVAQKVLWGVLSGGVVAGIDQAVNSGHSKEVVAYQVPPPSSQNLDDAVYVIIVSGTLGGVCILLIVILLLYICKLSRHPAGTPETVEMRPMA
ncbi:unnamed protein product [Orchesella dallaii]|uniref:Uncharacterized protein n=1 Tax=Orchesella dallaii TaxID=48710 RepID=A0ABP1RTZ9_9HEXA